MLTLRIRVSFARGPVSTTRRPETECGVSANQLLNSVLRPFKIRHRPVLLQRRDVFSDWGAGRLVSCAV